MLVYDAWLKMKKRFALYYYEVSNGEDTVQFAPTHYVNITETEPRKRRACYAHASQNAGQVLRVARARDANARHRERPQTSGGVHPARPESGHHIAAMKRAHGSFNIAASGSERKSVGEVKALRALHWNR